MKMKSSSLWLGGCAVIVGICGVITAEYLNISKGYGLDKQALLRSAIDQVNEKYERAYGVIRNPYDSRFDPRKFDFDYYNVSDCSRREILAKLFKIGTSKKNLEKILVDIGGAERRSASSLGGDYYTYHHIDQTGRLSGLNNEWIIAVYYDSEDALSEMKVGGRSVYDYADKCNARIDFDSAAFD